MSTLYVGDDSDDDDRNSYCPPPEAEAIWEDEDTGTADMVRRAKKAGIPVREIGEDRRGRMIENTPDAEWTQVPAWATFYDGAFTGVTLCQEVAEACTRSGIIEVRQLAYRCPPSSSPPDQGKG